jgi:hypothetical protein
MFSPDKKVGKGEFRRPGPPLAQKIDHTGPVADLYRLEIRKQGKSAHFFIQTEI